MQEIHKSRPNSEVKRRELLTRSASIRTEAEKLGAETQLLEAIDKIEQDIKSARVNIRKYRDFLKEESNQLETLRETLNAIKETKHKNFIDDIKGSSLLFIVLFIPYIFISKMYYLAQIPKNIPISSIYI